MVLSTLSVWFWFSLNPMGEGWFHQMVQKPESVALSHGHAEALPVAGDASVRAASDHDDPAHAAHYPAMALSIVIALGGILLARKHYLGRRAEMLETEAGLLEGSWLYRTVHNKWYFDENYDRTFVRGTLGLRAFLGWFDRNIIDGLVNLSALLGRGVAWLHRLSDQYIVDWLVNAVARWLGYAGTSLRGLQTGKLQTYVALVLAGILALMVIRMLYI